MTNDNKELVCKGAVAGGLHIYIRCLSCKKFTGYYVKRNLGHEVPKESIVDADECKRHRYKHYEKQGIKVNTDNE